MEQPATCVAVSTEHERTANGGREVNLKHPPQSAATRSCRYLQHLDVDRPWQQAALALDHHVLDDRGGGIVVSFQVARGQIRRFALPDPCWPDHRISLAERRGAQTESPNPPCPQFFESMHHIVE